jgi:PAS domain S-box-containing protein
MSPMKKSNYTKHRTGYIYLLIFVLLSACIVTGGYFAYRNYGKNYRTEVEQQLSAIADLKVNQIDVWRKERLGNGQVYYKNVLFSALVNRYIQNHNDLDAKAEILTWVGQSQSAYGYDLMMLLDAHWNTIVVYPENKERARLVIDQKNTDILQSGNIAFQDFYRNDQDQHVYIKVLVPILEKRFPKRLIAILALRISPEEYLYPLIKKWPTPSRTAETLLIRRDGSDALFLNDLKFRNDAALNLRIPLTSKNVLAVKAALGIEGIVEGIDYRGEQVIGDVRAIPDSPWFLVARMDMEEVVAPLKERLWLIIIFIGSILCGAGTIVGLVYRHQRASLYASRKNEEQYRIFNEQQQKILDASPAMIFYKDKENRFVRVNEMMARANGMSKSEMEGKTCWDMFPRQAADQYWQDDKEVISAGQSKLNIVETMETPRGAMYVQSDKIPYRDSNGTIIGIIGFTLDITERMEIEAEREKTRKELAVIKKSADEASEFAESVINTVREPLISLDQNLRVVTVSRSFYEFFKVKPEETVGQLIYNLGDKQWDIPKLRELLETILPQKASFDNYEVEHDFANIGRRTMLLNARQIQQASAKERIILLAIEDITGRKEIEAGLEKTRKELELTNKELEAFSYSVSHDLRAPLRHISGYVELLAKHFKSELSEKGLHYLDSIADSAVQMGKLIDNLLQFSRTGRAEMRRSDSDLNGIVQEVVESLQKDNPDRAIEWIISKLPSVYCDTAMIRLVWVNLLSNAVKFTQRREKALIEIGAKIETKEVIFFVKDNGVGFDMKYAQKLFGVFQRLHSTAEFEGTGVGLANVHRIITRHGGRTWAEAELDKGATFYFSLPK